MTARRSHRAVMAELLLLAAPTGIRVHGDHASMAITFATVAELRTWLDAAGLNAPDLLTAERERTDSEGRPVRSMYAYPTWHGWEIYADATEAVDVSPLDASTVAALTDVAVA
ncbi:hypothetical protein GA0074692_5285 [Micromonospora pallida]|uniref:Uncharacterized protein n=1 Tax=Micromonospora pallida TaxID=145854 RepID=A0A1C6TCD6_9ACTN|nr:hypothetical protein [Micromonospora pallida]SCL39222.1 hypothetical protein GA0074692_5285 [Micromonospora pallida]